jgi:hypothetical protein
MTEPISWRHRPVRCWSSLAWGRRPHVQMSNAGGAPYRSRTRSASRLTYCTVGSPFHKPRPPVSDAPVMSPTRQVDGETAFSRLAYMPPLVSKTVVRRYVN